MIEGEVLVFQTACPCGQGTVQCLSSWHDPDRSASYYSYRVITYCHSCNALFHIEHRSLSEREHALRVFSRADLLLRNQHAERKQPHDWTIYETGVQVMNHLQAWFAAASPKEREQFAVQHLDLDPDAFRAIKKNRPRERWVRYAVIGDGGWHFKPERVLRLAKVIGFDCVALEESMAALKMLEQWDLPPAPVITQVQFTVENK